MAVVDSRIAALEVATSLAAQCLSKQTIHKHGLQQGVVASPQVSNNSYHMGNIDMRDVRLCILPAGRARSRRLRAAPREKTHPVKLMTTLQTRGKGLDGSRFEETVARRALGNKERLTRDGAAISSALGLRAFFKLEKMREPDSVQATDVRIAAVSLPFPDHCVGLDAEGLEDAEGARLLPAQSAHITRHTRVVLELFPDVLARPPTADLSSDVCV